MKPVLAIIGSLGIYSFGVFLALGMLVTLFQVWRQTRVKGLSQERVLDVFFLSSTVFVLASRLGYVFSDWSFYAKDLGKIIMFLKYPGMSFEIGLISAAVSTLIFGAILGVGSLVGLDLMVFGVATGMILGFSGCALDGCMVGWPSNAPIIFLIVSIIFFIFISYLNKQLMNDPDANQYRELPGALSLSYLIFYLSSFLIASWAWEKRVDSIRIGIVFIGLLIFIYRYFGIWKIMKFPTQVLNQIKGYLEKRRKEIEKKMKALDHEDPLTTDDRKDTASDDMQAQNKVGHERVIALKRQLQLGLIQTRKALTKIKIGKYGVCESCGKMIDTDRLSIVPTATLCVACEKKRER